MSFYVLVICSYSAAMDRKKAQTPQHIFVVAWPEAMADCFSNSLHPSLQLLTCHVDSVYLVICVIAEFL